VLVAQPRVVLLDEPAAGLNDAETAWLAGLLRELRAAGVALVVVEHKLALLNDVCDRLVVLRLGEVVAEGDPASVWADDRVVEAYLGGAAPTQRTSRAIPGTGSSHVTG
jgi:ABC-type branched-subunit amino acid transport system ATPase component